GARDGRRHLVCVGCWRQMRLRHACTRGVNPFEAHFSSWPMVLDQLRQIDYMAAEFDVKPVRCRRQRFVPRQYLSLHVIQRPERAMNRVEWLDALRNDVMFGVRQLRKNPAFSLIAMLTLALGIGANSAIFSVVYNVLLRPLPYANAERIYT